MNTETPTAQTTVTHPAISIVGVPKSGTSSLHSWLDQLPGVCGSNPKETFYFMDEGNPLTNQKLCFENDQCRSYFRFFRNLKPGELTLDSTTHYFFQQAAMDQLAAAGTKICVVLREPATRLISYFQYVCETRDATRTEVDFGEFVDGLLNDDVSRFRESFFEEREFFALKTSLKQGHYADYLLRWKKQVASENLLVVLFEDLVANQERVLADIGKFFQISVGENELEMPQDNETYKPKYPLINRFARWASRKIVSERVKRPIRRFYLKFQKSKVQDIYSLYPQHVKALKQYYVAPIKQFNKVSGIATTKYWSKKNSFIAQS